MALRGPAGAPPMTVLMSVRASAARAAPLPLPPLPARSRLRLQLSAAPGTGARRRFRLQLRREEDEGGAPIAEYDLKDVAYKVQGPRSHELLVLGAWDEPLVLSFEEEREAQRWWTIVSSSLREVQKAFESALAAESLPPPPSANPNPGDQGAEEALTTELREKEDLALNLAQAIEFGDEEEASRCAVALARHQALLSILLRDSTYPPEHIRMKVGVEDATSSASITLLVRPHTTIKALKEQVFREYGFHPRVQRWIIGQCLCLDERSVFSYGIRRDGDPAFLYLLSAHAAELTPQRLEEDRAKLRLHSPGAGTWQGCGNEAGGNMDMGDMSRCLDSLQLRDPLGAQAKPPSPEQAGWPCPQCTFLNKPTRPGCEMCSAPRPDDYIIPREHRPDERERRRLQREQEGMRQYQQALEAERLQNLEQLLQLEQEVLVPNREALECLICFQRVSPGQGVLLRECLHSFCRECLRQVITFSEEPTVACPYRDDSYACSSHLQEREIRALVSPEEYRRFLERSLVLAERRSHNSFHCRTPDCRGWCIYEDSVNEFRCPVCQALNCLLCKAIHEGRNCRQYQDDLEARARNDAAARQTSAMLQTLVQRGDAMHCPTCLIVVQKKDGCDWIRCAVCQTEICWVTKGPRWGPAGPGDTSGGCRCNVNGQKCHPRCQNCH
ncbi:sharpin [Melopsittacus undulatus]|uniref:RanBP-type and C3HC4-type zinc finger-containing protein 1 n=1 Tax=Melopsittacus undulatus TaxID=13146 RepID=A0A8V5H0W8_MELUD|nr:sharpin [Melopsittacus undulatus]